MDVIGYALICFFCLYGLMQLCFGAVHLFFESRKRKDKKIYTVLFVENEEQSVEDTLRSLLWKKMYKDVGVSDSSIVVIDLGSQDRTAEIVQKMAEDTPLIHLCSPEEFLEYAKRDR